MPCAMPSDPPDPGRETRIVLASDPMAVREALGRLVQALRLQALPDEDCGTAEIVLAEALNNVVEHAYAASPGEIELTVTLSGGALTCTIRDQGRPMPGALPAGTLPALAPPDHIPEGGFGWHLIRALSRDLHYRRQDGHNLLSFRVGREQSPTAAGPGAPPETKPE